MWTRRLTLALGSVTGGLCVAAGLIKIQKDRVSNAEDDKEPASSGSGRTDTKLVSLSQAWLPKNEGLEVRLKKTIEEAQRLCERVKEQNGLPGLSVGVSVNGNIVWEQGLGYADIENGVKMKGATVVRIASISKSMTMGMLAKLIEEGKVDLDLPIQTYVPSFPQKVVDGEKVTITTRHLLSHLSGIRHYTTKEVEEEKKKEKAEFKRLLKASKERSGSASDPKRKSDPLQLPSAWGSDSEFREFFMKEGCDSVETAMGIFHNDELFHKPGTKYLYTTHGWTVVSAVIEKLVETPFAKHAKKMFDHWGLRNTYLDEHEPIIYNRARYYSKDRKGKLTNAPWVDNSCKWAGGGFLSNIPDLLRFANILLYSKQWTPASVGKPFLRPETMDKVWTGNETTAIPDSEALYAQGFVVVPPYERCVFCKGTELQTALHSGGAVGASSILIIRFPPQPNFITSVNLRTFSCAQDNRDDNQSSRSPEIKGVAVAMITNLTDIGLSSTAGQIADLFQWMV